MVRLIRGINLSINIFLFPVSLLLSILYIFSFICPDLPAKDKQSVDLSKNFFNYSATSDNSQKIGTAAITTESPPIKYNLMAETYGRNWYDAPAYTYFPEDGCTLEYANANQLQQDHPCVIHLIQNYYLNQPAHKSLPYNLDHPEVIDPSDGQSQAILKILQNKSSGFFIECGGYDGEFLSNTLYMERSLGWTGLLIEADKKAYSRLVRRNRKAYTSPVCLSTQPYPMQVIYNATVGTLSSILESNDGHQLPFKMEKERQSAITKNTTQDIYKMQCFPLYSILLAIGRTHIDYFGLDVEGSEYKILKTIPWHKVNVQTLTVEWNHTPEGEPAITQLMQDNNFIKFGLISLWHTREVVYVRDFLDDYRIFED